MSKKYKIIKSDLFIAGKIYKEGSIVNFIDESLGKYFEPVPEETITEAEKPMISPAPIIPESSEKPLLIIDEVSPAALEPIPIPESSIAIPKKGRPKKIVNEI